MTKGSVKRMLQRCVGSNLLFLGLIASFDGTLFVLAATGGLSTITGVVVAGLTIIAGVGCWIAAREEYGQRRLDRSDYAALALKGLLVTASAVAAAFAGQRLAGTGRHLALLPIGGGIIFALLALEVSGLKIPRLGKLPLAFPILAVFTVAEVVAWTL